MYEVLDGRNCSLWLRYLCGSYRCNTKKKQREIRRIDNHLLHDQERCGSPGARHGRSEDQRANHQAEDSSKKAHKKGFESILHHFRRVKSIEARRRTSNGLKSFASTETNSQKKTTHTLLLSQERQRYEKEWKLCLSSQGLAGPNRSRADYPETLRKLRDVKREAAEAGHEFNPTSQADRHVRQHLGQQFQQQKDPVTDHGATQKLLHGQSIHVQAGDSGNLLLPGRRLPRHGGHLQDGTRSGHICCLVFSKDFDYRHPRFPCKRRVV